MKLAKYFTKTEIAIWSISIIFILSSFMIFDRENYLTLIASLIGVTSLIFCAKGNPIGQVLMVFFSLIYAYISFSFSYYGELMTYAGMTLPMAVLALVSWLKNPYEGKKSEVKVYSVSKKDIAFMIIMTVMVTVVFYFILKYFNTANLFFSTLSVTTSFLAVYFTFRRSPYFALFYALNDVVLIVLWVLATITNFSFLSVVVCFIVFLINDLYGFLSWLKMRKLQALNA